MCDWRDFNHDGEVDFVEAELANEMIDEIFSDSDEEETDPREEMISELELRGYDSSDLELMDDYELSDILAE